MRAVRLFRPFVPVVFAVVAAGSWAGTVEVNWINPTSFTDSGNSEFDKPHTLEALAATMQQLGTRYLPADQRLALEVTDVDLAGTVMPDTNRSGLERRVMRGRQDVPRIVLRYTLYDATGQVLTRGAETITDLDYLRRFPTRRENAQPLDYEKRMLDDWFKHRFASAG